MKKMSWIIVFLMIAIIFYNSSLPGVASTGLSHPLAIMIHDFLKLSISILDFEHILRKCAHFTEYAILGILVFYAQHQFPLFKDKITFGLFMIIPFIDETIQKFTPNRSCELKDCLIDVSGYIFGIFTVIIVLSILNKRGKHHDKMES